VPCHEFHAAVDREEVRRVNVYCDNYATCNSAVLDWSLDYPSDDELRVRGWAVFRGESMTGKHLDVKLCGKCMASHRPTRAEVLEGQEELF
jgi:hypothetical protein